MSPWDLTPASSTRGSATQLGFLAAARLDGILATLEIDRDVKEYSDAGHSFMNDHRDEKTPWLFAVMGRFTGGIDFVEPSALDARGRIVAFFERHLRDGA
jgi:carboxymethylenebutenolidase